MQCNATQFAFSSIKNIVARKRIWLRAAIFDGFYVHLTINSDLARSIVYVEFDHLTHDYRLRWLFGTIWLHAIPNGIAIASGIYSQSQVHLRLNISFDSYPISVLEYIGTRFNPHELTRLDKLKSMDFFRKKNIKIICSYTKIYDAIGILIFKNINRG